MLEYVIDMVSTSCRQNMPRTSKSPKLATPNASAKKAPNKEAKPKRQTAAEPKPKTHKVKSPPSKTPSKKFVKQSKSPKVKTPSTKTPAKKERKSPTNLAVSPNENSNTKNNNVDEII